MTPQGIEPTTPALSNAVHAELNGPRVTLRRLDSNDAAAFGDLVIANIDHLRPFMPWAANEPTTLAQRRELIDTWARESAAGRDASYGTFVGSTIIGACGLHRRSPDPDRLEVGYWIGADHCGNGFATELTFVLAEEAFGHEEIAFLDLYCDDANASSASVAERAGFRLIDVSPDPESRNAPGQTGLRRHYQLARAELVANWRERF